MKKLDILAAAYQIAQQAAIRRRWSSAVPA